MNRALLIALIVCALLAGVAALGPFHLRYAPQYTGVLVLAALVLALVSAIRMLRERFLRTAAVAIVGLLLACWLGLIGLWVAFAGLGPDTVVRDGGTSGRIHLLVVRARAFDAPVFSVRLRTGGGPFAQETVVWEGLARGAAPTGLRFAADHTAEIVAAGQCGYRSTFDRVTLDARPVNRPIRPDGC